MAQESLAHVQNDTSSKHAQVLSTWCPCGDVMMIKPNEKTYFLNLLESPCW